MVVMEEHYAFKINREDYHFEGRSLEARWLKELQQTRESAKEIDQGQVEQV